jgi:hypothetical protein
MSTAVATPTQPLTTTEKFDIAYGLKTKVEKDGVTPILDEKKNPVKEAVIIAKVSEAEELSEKNLFEGSTITVKCDYPASWDGLVQFATQEWKNEDGTVRDPEDVKAEIVKLFNNGAAGKVMNRLRAIATKQDEKGNFTLTGNVVDLTNEITSGSKRVFLTEEQKTWKGLVNLPAPVKEQVWRAYLTATGKDFYLPAE